MKETQSNAEQILTIPNLLSLFRFVLIPIFIFFYLHQKYACSLIVLLLSTLSDVMDGYIARNTNTVTDLGKVLDPIADKLTQAAIMICLSFEFKWMLVLFAVLAVKELTMMIFGILVLKITGKVNGAKWYGKLCTTITVVIMAIHIVFPYISNSLSMWLCFVNMLMMIHSLVRYIAFDCGEIASYKRNENQESGMVEQSENA